MSAEPNPVVSVVVPARNEEACLGQCLDSLVSQTGISFELIVVDDASTDRTAEIARSFARPDAYGLLDATGKGATSSRADCESQRTNGTAESRTLPNRVLPNSWDITSDDCCAVVVISPAPLPENWTGKNNAMSAGAKIAQGKWLLFTDADTVHKPGSLARAVAEAEQHGSALLSYSPEQEVHTFWEKAVMPVIFAELAATYPPNKVSDPASPIAAANGQYLMVSREAYDALGGHTKIASDLLEDVAMARMMKSSGRRIFFRYGGDAVRTRMYRSWAQMKEGWTKNLALLFPKPTELAQSRFGEFILPPLALCMIVEGILLRRNAVVWIPGIWLRWYMIIVGIWALVASLANFVRRIRKAHFPLSDIGRAYLGLPVFAYFLLRSERSVKRARLDWKDRTYVYTPQEIEALRKKQAARTN